jgi:hypothetical protein
MTESSKRKVTCLIQGILSKIYRFFFFFIRNPGGQRQLCDIFKVLKDQMKFGGRALA